MTIALCAHSAGFAAIAFLIGLVLLHQPIGPWDLVGMVCVVVAGAGVTYDAATADLEVPQ